MKKLTSLMLGAVLMASAAVAQAIPARMTLNSDDTPLDSTSEQYRLQLTLTQGTDTIFTFSKNHAAVQFLDGTYSCNFPEDEEVCSDRLEAYQLDLVMPNSNGSNYKLSSEFKLEAFFGTTNGDQLSIKRDIPLRYFYNREAWIPLGNNYYLGLKVDRQPLFVESPLKPSTSDTAGLEQMRAQAKEKILHDLHAEMRPQHIQRKQNPPSEPSPDEQIRELLDALGDPAEPQAAPPVPALPTAPASVTVDQPTPDAVDVIAVTDTPAAIALVIPEAEVTGPETDTKSPSTLTVVIPGDTLLDKTRLAELTDAGKTCVALSNALLDIFSSGRDVMTSDWGYLNQQMALCEGAKLRNAIMNGEEE